MTVTASSSSMIVGLQVSKLNGMIGGEGERVCMSERECVCMCLSLPLSIPLYPPHSQSPLPANLFDVSLGSVACDAKDLVKGFLQPAAAVK